jgi:lipopolysaccharide transport system permease protein
MALGTLWVVLMPLGTLAVNTFIFGLIAEMPSDGLPYPLFNYAALLPWAFFAGIVNGTANSLLANHGLMKKIYFPRLVAPIVQVLNQLFNSAIAFAILLGMMLLYGYTPTWTILTIPAFLLLAILTGLAVGLWVAPWIVHYRDVSKVLNFGMTFWMYLTPVVYAVSVIPDNLLTLYRLNPMVNVVEGFRWAVLGTGEGPSAMLLVGYALVLPLLIGGMYYFRRAERSIVDIA